MQITEEAIKVIQEQEAEIRKSDQSDSVAILVYRYFMRS